jgi:integrase
MDPILGTTQREPRREPWNKGKIVGQKAPLKLKDIWALRVRLNMAHRVRELALLNLGIDSKLRGCDLVKLKVRDVCHGEQVATRAIVMQQKTQRPVQFEITQPTREAVQAWIKQAGLRSDDFLFPSRIHESPHLGTRQYARILEGWIEELGLDPAAYGTHSIRRTKATLIYRRTKNLRAVQLLLGHTKLESTVRYLGIEADDALEMAEQTEVRDLVWRANGRWSARSHPPASGCFAAALQRVTLSAREECSRAERVFVQRTEERRGVVVDRGRAR